MSGKLDSEWQTRKGNVFSPKATFFPQSPLSLWDLRTAHCGRGKATSRGSVLERGLEGVAQQEEKKFQNWRTKKGQP